MRKNRYYVVWNGRRPGVYFTWDECSQQVNGFTGAKYKAFDSLPAAQAAYRGDYQEHVGKPANHKQWLFSPSKPQLPSLCVDAACSGSPGPLEYRGVETETGSEIFRCGPYADGTNNIGEFLAIVHALAWQSQRNLNLPVYTDSETALAWLKVGRCRTQVRKTSGNAILFELIERAEQWLVENKPGVKTLKWDTELWGEIPADFGRK